MTDREIHQKPPGYDIVLTVSAYALFALGIIVIPAACAEVFRRPSPILSEYRFLGPLILIGAFASTWTTSALLFLFRDMGRDMRTMRQHHTTGSTNHEQPEDSPADAGV